MRGLDLSVLPPLPQRDTIRELAPRLWDDERVIALWIGGSLARGAGDRYSDIDLRIAVPTDDLKAWEGVKFAALLGDMLVGTHFIRLGDDAFIHHTMLSNGDILDFLLQGGDREPGEEPILILGCRDEKFGAKLASSDRILDMESAPATPEAIRELLVAFWINSHKHCKVLSRDLDLMFPANTAANWSMLMRLWFIAATGKDAGPHYFGGIHGFTELVRAVNQPDALAICGMPIRNREEICATIERQRDEAARVGRILAERYAFVYPTELEETVRRTWDEFKRDDKSAPANEQ